MDTLSLVVGVAIGYFVKDVLNYSEKVFKKFVQPDNANSPKT